MPWHTPDTRIVSPVLARSSLQPVFDVVITKMCDTSGRTCVLDINHVALNATGGDTLRVEYTFVW